MNKFQPVKFRNVDEFLEYLPENELVIVECLRQLIRDSIPECREKLAYNVPFYYKHSRICFIWPHSVPWGNVKINEVQLGFCNGYLLKDKPNYLEKGDRKQVTWKAFTSVNEIETDLLRSFIHEATIIDESMKRKI